MSFNVIPYKTVGSFCKIWPRRVKGVIQNKSQCTWELPELQK